MSYPAPRTSLSISPVIWLNGTQLYLKGSYGASSYELQYSSLNDNNIFSSVGKFMDNVPSGSSIYTLDKYGWYRVVALNENGRSDPSNAVHRVD